jgi:hypothetical protein
MPPALLSSVSTANQRAQFGKLVHVLPRQLGWDEERITRAIACIQSGLGVGD